MNPQNRVFRYQFLLNKNVLLRIKQVTQKEHLAFLKKILNHRNIQLHRVEILAQFGWCLHGRNSGLLGSLLALMIVRHNMCQLDMVHLHQLDR